MWTTVKTTARPPTNRCTSSTQAGAGLRTSRVESWRPPITASVARAQATMPAARADSHQIWVCAPIVRVSHASRVTSRGSSRVVLSHSPSRLVPRLRCSPLRVPESRRGSQRAGRPPGSRRPESMWPTGPRRWQGRRSPRSRGRTPRSARPARCGSPPRGDGAGASWPGGPPPGPTWRRLRAPWRRPARRCGGSMRRAAPGAAGSVRPARLRPCRQPSDSRPSDSCSRSEPCSCSEPCSRRTRVALRRGSVDGLCARRGRTRGGRGLRFVHRRGRCCDDGGGLGHRRGR